MVHKTKGNCWFFNKKHNLYIGNYIYTMRTVTIFIYLTLSNLHLIAQNTPQQNSGIQSSFEISQKTIDSIKTETNDLEHPQYILALNTAIISCIYMYLKKDDLGRLYYSKAINHLKKLSADSLIICINEINNIFYPQYSKTPNGFNLDILCGYNSLAISFIPESRFPDKENILISFLTNNAANYWKYDFSKAMKSFEKLNVISRVILVRGLLDHDVDDIEKIKDPMRRYVRFMYNCHFAKNSAIRKLCKDNNCLEKAWTATQLLKSRQFKRQIFQSKLSKLDSLHYKKALELVTYLDTSYKSQYYISELVSHNFKLNFKQQNRIDSIENKLSMIIPEYSYIVSDILPRKKIQNVLKEDEVYISLLYTDNTRNVYAWKIEKNKTPKIIKLNINSRELFFRTEYFRNEIINDSSFLIVTYEGQKYKMPLSKYLSDIYGTTYTHESNIKILFEKIIVPLDLAENKKLVFEVDQNLGSFPVGLLTNSKTGQYLLKDYFITYTPSASLFYYLRQKNKLQSYGINYLGFSYNADEYTYVDTIINNASKNFKKSRSNFYQCSESNIYRSHKLIEQAKYLHFTCHNNIKNFESFLQFGKDSENDGLISSDEISASLTNESILTVLTSCSTGPYLDEYSFIDLSLVDNYAYAVSEHCVCSLGETFSNLTGAFFAAGSNKMLVTQWEIIDDNVSATFMQTFFYHISNGITPESALRKTQEEFSSKYDIQYWGGYIIVGE